MSTIESEGRSNAQVECIQQALTDAGFTPGPVDGIFGGQTAAAVTAFGVRTGTAASPDEVAAEMRAAGLRDNTQYATVEEIEKAMPFNRPPVVDAGADIRSDRRSIVLAGNVADDQKPEGNPLSTAWEVLEGAGEVMFDDDSALRTTATFSAAGDYLLRLVADDGEFCVALKVVDDDFDSSADPILEVIDIVIENVRLDEPRVQLGAARSRRNSDRVAPLKVLDLLIEKGADIEAKDHEAETPLHWAVKLRLEKTTRTLLENGADLNVASVFLNPPYEEVQRDILFMMMQNSEEIKHNHRTIGINILKLEQKVPMLAAIVSMYRKIINADAVFVIIVNDEKSCTVIGRSGSDRIDIGSMLRQFGGGGHPAAGSATVKTADFTPEELKEEIVSHIKQSRMAGATVADPLAEFRSMGDRTDHGGPFGLQPHRLDPDRDPGRLRPRVGLCPEPAGRSRHHDDGPPVGLRQPRRAARRGRGCAGHFAANRVA